MLRPIVRLIRPILEVFMGYCLPWNVTSCNPFHVIYFLKKLTI